MQLALQNDDRIIWRSVKQCFESGITKNRHNVIWTPQHKFNGNVRLTEDIWNTGKY
jgi:hypothetical protein